VDLRAVLEAVVKGRTPCPCRESHTGRESVEFN